MNPIEAVLRRVDRYQQRHALVGLPFAVVRKFGDDRGGNLTTLLAWNAFFALFPLLLVLVTLLGYFLRRDPAVRQRVLHSVLAESWNIPGTERPSFWTRQARGLALLLVLALGLVATTLLTGLGSLSSRSAAFRLANLVASAGVNVGMFLLGFRVLTPRQIRVRQLVAGAVVAGVAWQGLLAAGGYPIGHNLRHASEIYPPPLTGPDERPWSAGATADRQASRSMTTLTSPAGRHQMMTRPRGTALEVPT